MKKLLSILLTFIMLLALLPANISFAEDSVFGDIKGTEYYADSAEILAQMGILTGYNDGSFGAEKNITRAEMATIVCRLIDKEAIASQAKGKTDFDDVASDHWASGYINNATKEGIIGGDGNGKFRPGDNVKYEEAVKMLVCALGYAEDIEVDPDDWSRAYLDIAQEKGITDNLKGHKGEAATRGDIAVMVLNGIETSKTLAKKLDSVEAYNSYDKYAPDNTYKVTFMLNDNTENVYAVQHIIKGNTATSPTEPVRDMYEFTGWYKDENLYDFSSPVNEDITLYAAWTAIAEDADSFTTQSESETLFSITDVKLTGGVVSATVNVNSKSTLVFNFLDENTKETLHILSSPTPDYGEALSVSVPVSYSLPDYFLITADLYNRNSKKLCDTYTCIYYTSAFETFNKQTVNDFDSDRVISFDDSNNNFGVFNEDVIRITCSENANKLSVEENDLFEGDFLKTERKYTVTNPDSSVASLKSGDKIYIDSTSYLFKIATISDVDGNIVITESTDTTIYEFYDVLKVNMPSEEELSTNHINPSPSPSLPIVTAPVTKQEKKEYSFPYAADFPTVRVPSSNFDLSVTTSIEGVLSTAIAYDIKTFSDSYFYCKVVNNMLTSDNVYVVVKAGVSNDDKLKKPEQRVELPKLSIYTGVPGMFVRIRPTLVYAVEVSGKLNIKHRTLTTNGFVFSTLAKENQRINQKFTGINMQTEGEVSAKLGVATGLAVEFLSGAVSAGLIGEIGVAVNGELKPIRQGKNFKHACTSCIDGTTKLYADLYASLDYKITDKIKGTLLKIEFVKGEYPLGRFYVSLKNDAESMFGGKPKFGTGQCPNRAYKATIIVPYNTDSYIKPIINIDENNGSYNESATPPYETYLYPGTYTVTATLEEGSYSDKEELVISDKSERVVLSVGNFGSVCFFCHSGYSEEEVIGDDGFTYIETVRGNILCKRKIYVYKKGNYDAPVCILSGASWPKEFAGPIGDYYYIHYGKEENVDDTFTLYQGSDNEFIHIWCDCYN